jgi:hypothetical protein
MNALIGNNEEVKIILLSCDDESEVPSKKDIKGFYPDSLINIYKASGHFSDNFWEMESLLKIRLKGIESQGYWGGAKCITHAIRLNADCERSLFFDLKYAEMVVGYFTLNHRSLDTLHKLITGVAKFNSEIKSITDCVDKFESVKNAINAMSLNDPKIDNPCKNAISILFDDYGKEAAKKILDFIERWYQKYCWT